MIPSFYARHYPAGREVQPGDQPVPTDTSVSSANEPSSIVNDTKPSDVSSAVSGVPASSNDPNPAPTPADVPSTTPAPSNPPPVVTPSPAQNFSPPESSTVPDQNPTSQGQYPPSSTPAQDPAPSSPPDQYTSTSTDTGPAPANSNSPNSDSQGYDPASSSSQPTQTDYFVPSSALNYPPPSSTQTLGTDITPASSSTIVSTHEFLLSSTTTSSTATYKPTHTAVLTHQGALSTSSSNNRKYIIGGAVGGGVLVLILLALLLFCCCRRRAKRDLERSGDSHSEGRAGYGQFVCCDHGTCSRNNAQSQMEQKTPLKPFVLKSGATVLTPKEGPQQHNVSLNRRDSTESQKSAGSDVSTGSSYSPDSEGSQRGRRSQKRPPPLKLTSLVTPVINGPQDNPRNKVDRSSLQNPQEVPTIIVEPPRSETPDRMKRR
ncbi:hypothetical protein BDM02DRAFT_3122696 [Thelephora ganbajun]|uniref:Uncharacterized protein n=1 Tax=Thelephora ganbajun TaxID=370292 RepID=A0ACB6Z311_THEGA|nr:hypothetical protein BDM02DRAFT_3122696 [Thelephora ganbajun]